MESMHSPEVTTTPNEAYEQRKGKEEEETLQYEVMSTPTASSTDHAQPPLPAVPSPPDAPTESVDKAEEQAVYEPIPGEK